MRKNSRAIGWVLAAAVLAGCMAEGPTVFVDVDAIAQGDAPAVSLPPLEADLTVSAEGAAGEIFALKETPSVRGALGREAENAKEILEHARADAREALRNQLLRVNEKAVSAWQLEEGHKIDAEEKALVDSAYAAIAEKLSKSAPEQGAIMAELAYRIAFPIPQMAAWPPVPEDSPWRKNRRADSVQRYERLVQLRLEFEAEVAGLLESASGVIARRREAFNRELEARIEEARANADKEADAMLLASRSAFESELAAATTQPQQALPVKSVRLARAKAPPSSTITSPQDKAQTRQAAREMVLHDLEIWCAENGYRLSTTPGRARDVTKEFLAWRNTHHPGR